MDPIRNVLDERFFRIASPECMEALAQLIDDALAKRFENYLHSGEADAEVANKIEEYLGPAIKAATFHLLLLERGSVDLVRKLDLETVADIRFDQQNIIQELEFLRESIQYIRAYIEPRKKSDYDTFLQLLPHGYKTKVSANRVMFYQPLARPRSTEVGDIIRKRDVWAIALKGLQFRDYFAKAGYVPDSYLLKEF